MTGAEAGRPDRRAQMIEVAVESLKDVGYAGTSIREIARRGGFNSALISYYFGGLHRLLLAALDHSWDCRCALRMVPKRDSPQTPRSMHLPTKG